MCLQWLMLSGVVIRLFIIILLFLCCCVRCACCLFHPPKKKIALVSMRCRTHFMWKIAGIQFQSHQNACECLTRYMVTVNIIIGHCHRGKWCTRFPSFNNHCPSLNVYDCLKHTFLPCSHKHFSLYVMFGVFFFISIWLFLQHISGDYHPMHHTLIVKKTTPPRNDYSISFKQIKPMNSQLEIKENR